MKSLIMALVLFLTIGAAPARAAVDEDVVEALRAEIQALSQRIAQLESSSEQTVERVSKVENGNPNPSWTDRLKLNADFRYRHEAIDDDIFPETRSRHRYRARAGVTTRITDTVDVGLQLASGGSEPTSTNQTLDNGASTKGVGVDLAYVEWQATDNISVLAGKFKNPMHRAGGNELVWDGDLNPEGIAVSYDGTPVFANLMGLWIEERAQASDSLMLGAQVGVRTEIADGVNLTAGASYYDFSATQGRTPFFIPFGFGNSLDANGNYLFDFNEVELFAELSLEVADMPLSLFADYVNNTDADQFDTGIAIGAKLGKASAPRSWELGWIYQDLEADAVLGLLTDSDFGGAGTDAKGHVLKGAYALNKKVKLNATYFINETGANAGTELDYNRLQLDVNVKY